MSPGRWAKLINLGKEAEENDLAKAKEMARDEAIANGGGMECGCCFSDELLVCPASYT